ncbi:hypothetical protein [Oleiagrimonas sp. C23AA]|uniref:hypothetical protein n=1 Tax=Oleiagrimonas sp. C23AA TaxID=2719047 RepID=UPI00141F38F7|nr:hypothetical protein [Oleiagrimonas sp. C23AA]NII12161.1 hypothetical protein [Oleiagrimonas sp. C23AA]
MARAVYRRYRREFGWSMAAYVAVMLLAFPLTREVTSPTLKWMLALLPMVPIGFAVRAMVRLVLGSDELEQRQHLVGLAVAVVVVGMLSLLGGFLDAAGVIHLSGDVLLWVFPALAASYGFTRQWKLAGFGMVDESEQCARKPWVLVGIGAVLLITAALAWGHTSDYILGLLLGMGGTMLLGAAFHALVLRRARRHAEGDL